MSLISDALKKAQRARTGEGAGAGSPSGGGRRGSHGAGIPFAWIAGGAVLLVAGAIGITVFVMRPSPAEVPARTKQESSKDRPPAPAVDPAATPKSNLGIAIPPATSKSVITETPKAAPPPATAPAPQAPAAAVPYAAPAAAAPVRRDPKIEDFVDSMKLPLYRLGDDPRIFMNDRVYHINDYIDRTLGLRLTSVRDEGMTFTDERGVTYTRNF